MKLLLFALIAGLSTSAFAQEGTMSMEQAPAISAGKKTGFYAGIDYMNLTDMKMDLATSGEGRSSRRHTTDTFALGTAGVRLGYDNTPVEGLGFSGGLRFLEAFNQSEYGSAKMQLYIPEANMNFALTPSFLLYAGVNLAIYRGTPGMEKQKPNLGTQAGFGVRFTERVIWNAGYTLLRTRAEETVFDYETKLETELGGFSTGLSAMF